MTGLAAPQATVIIASAPESAMVFVILTDRQFLLADDPRAEQAVDSPGICSCNLQQVGFMSPQFLAQFRCQG